LDGAKRNPTFVLTGAKRRSLFKFAMLRIGGGGMSDCAFG
jgi:hypothetical protein